MAKGLSLAREQPDPGPWLGENDGGGGCITGEGILKFFYHKKFKHSKLPGIMNTVAIGQFQQLLTHGQFCLIYIVVHTPLDYFEADPSHGNILTFNILVMHGV